MFDELRKLMAKDISRMTFDANMYLSEDFFEESIRNNFAGWYNESEIHNNIDFILKETQIPPGSKVLDVACGHGKYSELIENKGFHVKGIDISCTLINYPTWASPTTQ